VRSEEGQQGQRRRFGADVVQRDAPAQVARLVDGAHEIRRPVEEVSFRDLQDDLDPLAHAPGEGRQPPGPQCGQRRRLDVDEQGQRCGGTSHPLERGLQARLVQGFEAASPCRISEQVGRVRRVICAAGQRLHCDESTSAKVHDRLVHREPRAVQHLRHAHIPILA